MDKFLKTYNLPKLNREVIESPIINKETDSVIKNLSTKTSSGPDGFMGKFYQILKEYLFFANSPPKKISTHFEAKITLK